MTNTVPRKVETFTTDLLGLTAIQITLLPGKQFVYFRKGEAENHVLVWFEEGIRLAKDAAVLSTSALGAYLALRKDIKIAVSKVRELWNLVRSEAKGSFAGMSGPNRRVIACPVDPDVGIALETLRESGWQYRRIPPEQAGKFRYFVNEEQYCVFFRSPDDTFHGFRGSDMETIARLKALFEDEWKGDS